MLIQRTSGVTALRTLPRSPHLITIRTLKSAGAPKALKLVIVGESLFNDGVALSYCAVVFSMFAQGLSIG